MRYLEPDPVSQRRALIKAVAHPLYSEFANCEHFAVVDMTQPSHKKRLALYYRGQLVDNYHVTHGVNSSNSSDSDYANKFSNTIMSKKSSLGAMKTGSVYYGKHGRSLRLHGLEKGINDNIYTRSIVIHSARYASEDYVLQNGKCGESWGCLAVSPSDSDNLIDKLKGGSYIYVHY